MTAATHTAPSWIGPARWRVRQVGKIRNGLALVVWLEGPLRGREARLSARSLEPLR